MKLSQDQVNTILKNAPANVDKKVILDGLITRGYELEGVDTNAVKQRLNLDTTTQEVPISGNMQVPKQEDNKDKPGFLSREVGILDNRFGAALNDFKGTSEKSKGEPLPVRILQGVGSASNVIPDTIVNAAEGLGNMVGFEKGRGLDITKSVDQLKDSSALFNKDINGLTKTIQRDIRKFDFNQSADKVAEFLGKLNRSVGTMTPEERATELTVGDHLIQLSQKYPGLASGIESILKGASASGETANNLLILDGAKGVTDLAANTTKNVAQDVSKSLSGAVSDVANTTAKVTDMVVNSGAGQITRDLASRVPRTGERIADTLAENAVRSKKISSSSPVVQNAYKVNLDERIINTVSQADDATKQAYKQVVDIAEEAPKTVGAKKQPSIVSGDLAVKQYDLINKQKKIIGEQIGEVTKTLSKTEKLNMQDSFKQIDDILANQGISPKYTKKGVKLDFTGSKYTPAERTKIQELYNLATEGGDSLSPAKIKDKDQLFSKLKREAQYEGVGDLIIETPDGSKSLFNVFRDIYSGKLDTISPEVRALNNEYRKLSQITEDIEDSIFKTPNFNVTKTVDPAEFAKVNMRRIFGEAQSSPVFEAVADVMDKASRGLGYKGATPKQVAEFAEYIRKLYPETIPKTGFQGGIKTGLSDIIEQVSKVGTPNITDQRKALLKLLTESK